MRATIRDAEGRIIRAIESTREAGVNLITWDLKAVDPSAKAAAGEPRLRDVAPGVYRAEIASGNHRVQVDVSVHAFNWRPTT